MKTSQKRINNMPASTLKQIERKNAAQKRLDQAVASVEGYEKRLADVQSADESVSDLSKNLEDVVVQSTGDLEKGTHSLIEADFRGDKIDARFQEQEGLLAKKDLRITDDGETTRYFESSLSISDISKGPQYSYQEVRVSEKDGEVVYDIREGEGAWAQRWQALKAGLEATAGVFSMAVGLLRGLNLMSPLKNLPKKFNEHREKVAFNKQVQIQEQALFEAKITQAAETLAQARFEKEGEKLIKLRSDAQKHQSPVKPPARSSVTATPKPPARARILVKPAPPKKAASNGRLDDLDRRIKAAKAKSAARETRWY